MVSDVLGDMLNKFVFIYLDGILIFSCSEIEQIQHVRAVLQNQLFLRTEKCEFHSPTVSSSLGFILSTGNIKMDPGKDPTERNYDIGGELEERQHCLKEAEHPLIVLTDHNNLEYLGTAKLLNSFQAQQALLSHTSPSLLRQSEEPDFILPASACLGASQLDIEDEVINTLRDGGPGSVCLPRW